jgi:hypothetical protein
MADSSLLEFSAILAAHERLIQDLLFNYLGRMQAPFSALDDYARRLQEQPIYTATPGIDPAESDLLNQLISEALARTLSGVRSDLEKRIRQARQRKLGPPPAEEI